MNLLILCFAIAFLLGSIPFGILVAKAKGIDLRKVGSGNIGATNVTRALGGRWGMGVFVLDLLKGVVPTLIARFLITEPVGILDPQMCWLLAGVGSVLGHMFSPWLKFKGGKGISTSMGMALAGAPVVALSCFAVFTIIVVLTRYISLGAIVGVGLTAPLALLLPFETKQALPLYFLILVLVVWRHLPNIERLKNGTESKFSFKKAEDSTHAKEGTL